MRHKLQDKKLGRSGAHRKALMSALVCGLIEQKRIKTTLAKAKCARSLAEKMVTLARKGSVAARRRALSVLHHRKHVITLFNDIAPKFIDRPGGYTRVTKLGKRKGDGSDMAVLEWVDLAPAKKAKKKKTDVDSEAK